MHQHRQALLYCPCGSNQKRESKSYVGQKGSTNTYPDTVCITSPAAGKYIPSLAYEIHTRNAEGSDVRIPLKGMAIGDGLVDPIHQWFYGEFLYQNGFIDEQDKEKLNEMSNEAVELLQKGTTESKLRATLVI